MNLYVSKKLIEIPFSLGCRKELKFIKKNKKRLNKFVGKWIRSG